MSADGRAVGAPANRVSPQRPDDAPQEETMPPMSELLAAGAAAEAVCTPPPAPGDTGRESSVSDRPENARQQNERGGTRSRDAA